MTFLKGVICIDPAELLDVPVECLFLIISYHNGSQYQLRGCSNLFKIAVSKCVLPALFVVSDFQALFEHSLAHHFLKNAHTHTHCVCEQKSDDMEKVESILLVKNFPEKCTLANTKGVIQQLNLTSYCPESNNCLVSIVFVLVFALKLNKLLCNHVKRFGFVLEINT